MSFCLSATRVVELTGRYNLRRWFITRLTFLLFPSGLSPPLGYHSVLLH